MEGWNTIIFGVIPILTVAALFLLRRKMLWTAPLLSTVLAFFAYMAALAPVTMAEVFRNGEWRGFFFLAMLLHLAVAAVLTVIAYLAAYFLKRKQ